MSESASLSPSTFDFQSLYSAKDIIAVITCGGTGLGLMMATALENNGATVYIIGRRKEVLESAAAKNSRHGKIYPLAGDITSKPSLTSLVSTITSKHGYINLLINNAGVPGRQTGAITPPDQWPKSPSSLTDINDVQPLLWEDAVEDWQRTFTTNVLGPYFTTVAFLGLLAEGNRRNSVPQGSQVITTGSISGFARMNTTSFQYNASKAAVMHLGNMLATALSPWDIRSNIIAPGIYPSEMSAGVDFLNIKFTKDRVPAQRAGREEEIGGIILFLAGKAGAYMNGCVVVTDGGRLATIPSTY